MHIGIYQDNVTKRYQPPKLIKFTVWRHKKILLKTTGALNAGAKIDPL